MDIVTTHMQYNDGLASQRPGALPFTRPQPRCKHGLCSCRHSPSSAWQQHGRKHMASYEAAWCVCNASLVALQPGNTTHMHQCKRPGP